jgi:hypothetical protein
MIQPTSHPNRTIGRNFSAQWILGNSLSWGLGIGLPIILADLLSSKNYIPYGVASALSFGVWVGLAQWIVLRQVVPVSWHWITMVALSPILTGVLINVFSEVFAPLSLILIILLGCPLLLSLGQWWILRSLFRPCWGWIIISTIAICIGILTSSIGWIVGITFQAGLGKAGIPVLLGGMCCGFIYSVITRSRLIRLIRQDYQLPASQSSRLDTPPGNKSWITTGLSLSVLFAVLAAWLFICPFPAASVYDPLPNWFRPIFAFSAPFVYIKLSVLVHELGHLLLGLWNGFDLKYFAVGRSILVRRSEGFKWYRMSRRSAGGFVSSVARSQNSLNRRLFMMILGGPLASFVLFGITTIPLFFRELINENRPLWLITFLAFFNLHMAIFNLLPLRIGYWHTDGRRMLDLFKNNLQGQRFVAIYGYGSSLRQGIRPRNIEPALVDRALSIPEKSADHISGLLIAYSVAMDQGSIEQAGDYLDQALDLHLYIAETFRGQLLIEGVYFEAHIRHRVEIARQWLEKIQEKSLMGPIMLRGEAALLLAEGDRVGASTKIDEALANAHRDQFMVGSAIAEIDYLQSMRIEAML